MLKETGGGNRMSVIKLYGNLPKLNYPFKCSVSGFLILGLIIREGSWKKTGEVLPYCQCGVNNVSGHE